MGYASRRKSTRAGKAPSGRRSRTPPRRSPSRRLAQAKPQPPDRAELLCQLNEVRSIFACAARCLDELCDPHRLEESDECAPIDVAVVVRTGIAKLRKTQEFLDMGSVEGAS